MTATPRDLYLELLYLPDLFNEVYNSELYWHGEGENLLVYLESFNKLLIILKNIFNV